MGAGESGGPRPARFCAFAFFLGRPTGRLLRRPPEASARVAAAAAAFDALLAAASGLGGRPRFLAAATAEGSAGDAIGCLRGLPRFFGSGAGSAGGTGGLLTGLLATAETGASDLRGRPRFRPAAGVCTTCAVGVPTGIATRSLFLLPTGRPRGRLGVFSPAVWAVGGPGTDIVRAGRDKTPHRSPTKNNPALHASERASAGTASVGTSSISALNGGDELGQAEAAREDGASGLWFRRRRAPCSIREGTECLESTFSVYSVCAFA